MCVGLFLIFFYVIDAINDIYLLSYFAVAHDLMCYNNFFLHGVCIYSQGKLHLLPCYNYIKWKESFVTLL